MLLTINDAKTYAIEKVEELTGEKLDDTEKEIISSIIEEDITEKIYEIVSEEEIQSANLSNEEELEGYLFQKIPNYSNILEEITTEFIANYLSDEEETEK